MVTFRNNNNNRRIPLEEITEALSPTVIVINLVLQIMITLKENLQEEIIIMLPS